MSDALGDRMKEYERRETADRFLPLIPVYARIDGRGFSRFTKGFDRPYDLRFREMMRETTRFLVRHTHAKIGYTQSDEISLCWDSERYDSSIFFDGRKQKMVSQLAALATQRFNALLFTHEDPWLRDIALNRAPTFDARVFQIPTRAECVNAFVWRELDATKNAVTMAARCYYSHGQLHQKNSSDMHEMLHQKGVNFNNYPALFKRGEYLQRRQVRKEIEDSIWDRIPIHRRPASRIAIRSEVVLLDLPPLLQIENREAVIFEAAIPITRKKED